MIPWYNFDVLKILYCICVKIRFLTLLFLKFKKSKFIISTNVNLTLSNVETTISFVIHAFSNYLFTYRNLSMEADVPTILLPGYKF